MIRTLIAAAALLLAAPGGEARAHAPQSAEVTELLEQMPGSVGKYAGWLLKLKAQARYSIEGFIQADTFAGHIIYISLNDDGKLLKTWHETTSSSFVVAEERRLAFAAMKRLVRHINK